MKIVSSKHHLEVGPFFPQQQFLQQGAERSDLADVHLGHGLDAVLQDKLEALLHVLLKQLQQVRPHRLWQLLAQCDFMLATSTLTSNFLLYKMQPPLSIFSVEKM